MLLLPTCVAGTVSETNGTGDRVVADLLVLVASIIISPVMMVIKRA
jgi:hypothetical protein